MVKRGHYRGGGHSRPHKRKATQKGSSGMKGYSRYGSSGKGLSDKGYASWATARSKAGLSTVIKNPASYLMGMAALGTPVGWAGKPGYAGSGLEGRVKQAAVAARGMTGERTTSYSGGTPGAGIARAAMGGMGRGEWERPQIKKLEGEGSGAGTALTLGGIAALLWTVLK